MKNKDQILLILSIIITFMLGIYVGITVTQKEYEHRALELADDIECFTNRDIEHILYNTPAENKAIISGEKSKKKSYEKQSNYNSNKHTP